MIASIKDLEKEFWLRARNAGIIEWVTKDGKHIALKDMSNEHLLNTLNMLKRQAEEEYIEYDAIGGDWMG